MRLANRRELSYNAPIETGGTKIYFNLMYYIKKCIYKNYPDTLLEL